MAAILSRGRFAVEQSQDYTNGNEVTLKDMGENKIKH